MPSVEATAPVPAATPVEENSADLTTADRIGQELVRLLRIVAKTRHQSDSAVGHVPVSYTHLTLPTTPYV